MNKRHETYEFLRRIAAGPVEQASDRDELLRLADLFFYFDSHSKETTDIELRRRSTSLTDKAKHYNEDIDFLFEQIVVANEKAPTVDVSAKDKVVSDVFRVLCENGLKVGWTAE